MVAWGTKKAYTGFNASGKSPRAPDTGGFKTTNNKKFAYAISFWGGGLDEIQGCKNREEFEEVADDCEAWAYGPDEIEAMIEAGGIYTQEFTSDCYDDEDFHNDNDALLVEFNDDDSIASIKKRTASFSSSVVFYINCPDGMRHDVDCRDY